MAPAVSTGGLVAGDLCRQANEEVCGEVAVAPAVPAIARVPTTMVTAIAKVPSSRFETTAGTSRATLGMLFWLDIVPPGPSRPGRLAAHCPGSADGDHPRPALSGSLGVLDMPVGRVMVATDPTLGSSTVPSIAEHPEV
jgi:hypothetical protein